MFEKISRRICEETGYEKKKRRPIGYIYQDRRFWMILEPPHANLPDGVWRVPICRGYIGKDSTIFVEEWIWLNGTWSALFCETLHEKEVWSRRKEFESND